MLRGELIGLRALTAEDLAVLQQEVFNDVELMLSASRGGWRPRSLADIQDQHGVGHAGKEDPTTVRFAVEELSNGEFAGSAQLWGIDTHNRSAHLGLSLRPNLRGRGLGVDTIRTLCDYGFRVHGLHRLQAETLAANTAARTATEAAGFILEGQLRRNTWAGGDFVDEVVYGLLAHEWANSRT
ncbi:MAG TPA: GNAT family protein [Micromonosporaceae bacterium]|nr:GNAT family protein [Micromonosporaceae bacterium]